MTITDHERRKDAGTPPAATQKGAGARLGGQTEEQKKVFSGLLFAAVMAIALVYMVLASQFNSLLNPLVICEISGSAPVSVAR